MGALDTLIWIADDNAATTNTRTQSTIAMLERKEWAAFKAKLDRQQRKLLSAEGSVDDIEEDDVDALLVLIDALGVARKKPMTLFEIVRALQRGKVLSLEFAGPARAQAKRLLAMLEKMKRVKQDTQGRWSLTDDT